MLLKHCDLGLAALGLVEDAMEKAAEGDTKAISSSTTEEGDQSEGSKAAQTQAHTSTTMPKGLAELCRVVAQTKRSLIKVSTKYQ